METVLITGANRGLGLEFVHQLLAQGFRVLACCRDPEKAFALQRIERPELKVLSLDVSDYYSIETLGFKIAEEEISLFINNAGIYGQIPQTLEDADPEDWEFVFRVNCIAPLLLTRLIKNFMPPAKSRRIVFLSSKMGSITDNLGGGTYVYRSSKTALNQVMKSLSLDLAAEGFKVAALHPGWVRTDMGGPNGLIDPQESVAGMMKVIESLDERKNGRFIAYDGQEIPW